MGLAQQRVRTKATPFKDFSEAEAFIEKQSEYNLFSGAVLVQSTDSALIKKAYGLANKKKMVKNTTDTRFNIGSINKVFTAVCVMQLVERGKITLEDKIRTYIPELKMPMADEITVQHLLEMKSGLGSYWDSKLFQEKHKQLKDIENYLPIVSEYELSSRPGTERQYSNSGYELLGILVQRVSGKNYYEYVRDNIYGKIGMKNTDSYARDHNNINLAQGYTNYSEGEPLRPNKRGDFKTNVWAWQPLRGTAAGGGYSTLDDLSKFLIALSNNKLLTKASTDMVVNKFRPFPNRKTTFSFRGGSYGVNAEIHYNSDKEIAVIVLANYDPPTASNLANRLIETLKQRPNQTVEISDKAKIEGVVERFKNGIASKNHDQFVALFETEEKISWVGIGSFGKQFGSPSGFIKMLQSTEQTYREDFHNVEIWNDEHMATVTFDYGFFGNIKLSNWGKESWMLIKEHGKWKITSVNYSIKLPHQEPYPFH
jgi:CubicO group peptidase (beta-lactamase class C family)